MTRSHLVRLAALAAALALTHSAAAAAPSTVNFQAYLSTSDGTPVDGTMQILFSLYDSETGGNVLWTRTRTVTVAAGLLDVELGLESPLPEGVFDQTVYLGITIAGESDEMTPRRKLTAAPYALAAADAAAEQSWPGNYYNRLFRGDAEGDGMDNVSNSCAVCCLQ